MATSSMFEEANKNHHSECQSLKDIRLKQSDQEIFSEFLFEEDNDLYDFMDIRQKTGKFLSEFSIEDEIDIFQVPINSPPRFAVEYEDCRDGNRSQCASGDPDDKDTGLDSTMSFSIKDEVHSRRNHRDIGAYSQRNKATLSHFDGE